MKRLFQWDISTMKREFYVNSSRGGWVCFECNSEGAF